MKRTLWQIAIAVRTLYGVNLTAHSNEAPHSKKLWGYLYVDYPIANSYMYEADPMADSHSCQSIKCIRVNLTAHSYEAPHSKKLWGYQSSVWSGVKHPAHSYETPHSIKLWGYPYVDYPIANTYEVDPMADSHSYQSSVWSWSELYDTQLRSPHMKTL